MMPDNTRQVSSGTQSYVLGDRRFIGIQTNLQPNALDVGYVQDVTNLFVDGSSLTPRPGWQAELTSSLPDPIYALTGYRTKDNQDNKAVFVSGNAIYSHVVSNPITNTNAHLGYGPWADASQVRLTQLGKYIYGVPGAGTEAGASPALTGGCMFRTDGTNPIEYVPQLEGATTDGDTFVKNKVTLSGVTVKTITSRTDIDNAYLTTAEAAFGKPAATGWPSTWSDNLLKNSTRTPTLSPIIPSGDFDGYDDNASSSNTYFNADWTSDGGASVKANVVWAQKSGTNVSQAPNSNTYSSAVGGTKKYLVLDNVGEFVEQVIENLPYEQWPPATASSKIGLFNLQWYSFANIVKTEASVKYVVTVSGLNSSSNVIGGAIFSKEYNQAYATNEADWILNNIVVDFREFASQLVKIKIRIENAAVLANQDIIIDNIRFHASVAALTTSTTAEFNDAGLVSIKFYQENTNLGSRNASYVKNRAIRVLFASPYMDFQTVDTLSFKWDFESSLVKTNGRYPNIVLGIQKSGSTNIAWSSIGEWDKTNRYISFNIYRLTREERKSIQYVYVKFLEDVFKEDDTSFSTWEPAFGIGDIVKAGTSLTPNNGYEYAFTRWYPESLTSKLGPDQLLADGLTSNGYESNLSDVSNTAFTTPALSAASVVLNPLVDTGSVGYQIDLSKDRKKVVAVTDATNADQHLVTSVPAEYQIRLISSNATPSITYIALNGTTVTVASGSWTALSGTNYYYYSVPATQAGKIRYVTSVTGPIWLEHYVAYGKVNYYASVTASTNAISVVTPFAVGDTIVFTTTLGNLTGGTTYYVLTNSGTAITVSLSSGGAVVTPSTSTAAGTYATIQRTAPAQYSHILVYRRCNTLFPDGRFRLVASVPYDPSTTGTQTITGPNWTATYDNTSATAPGVITLVDTVPDTDLLYIPELYKQGQILEIGRDNLPLGASSIAVFQSRIFTSKGNVVFGSWELQQGQEYGIYTTQVPDLNEPGVQKKGASFTVGGYQDKEIIRAMISSFAENIQQSNSNSAILYILKDNSVNTIIGFDPTTFTAQLWVSTPGAGIAAPNSLINADGQVMWLGVNGVVAYNQGQIIPRSTELRKLLSLDPTMQGPANISKDFYRQSFSLYANRRLLLTSTSSGAGGANQTVYVYDTRTNGWVKWTTINAMTYTSGCVLSFSDSIQTVLMGSTTGQLYKLTGTTDNLDTATTASISWSILTRQHGQTYSEGVAYHAINRAYQLDLHVQNNNALTSPSVTAMQITWRVETNLGVYLNNGTTTYNFTTGTNRSIAIRNLNRAIKSAALQIRLSGNTSGTFYIHAAHIHCYDAAIQRS